MNNNKQFNLTSPGLTTPGIIFKTMTVIRKNGTIIISDIIKGYREERKYMYYSAREAKKLFTTEFKQSK